MDEDNESVNEESSPSSSGESDSEPEFVAPKNKRAPPNRRVMMQG